ncbi:MAG: hypothetical protein JXM73_01795 [Anaerolineae bacterium]|nr:hypothetical protein [Anaerolineae bacterium]
MFALTLAAGLAAGLVYAWGLAPVAYYNAAPDSLGPEQKQVYLALIGDLYATEGDLQRAKLRLSDLGIEPDGSTLTSSIEQYLDSGGRTEEVHNLAKLARDLGATGGVLLVFGSTPKTSTPVAVEPSPTPPTLIVTATPGLTFRLVERTATCAPARQIGKIVVRVRDAKGNGMPGVKVAASWATGQDRFYTGLRPELGPGYADLQMARGVEYEVSVADAKSDVARGLSAELAAGVCPPGSVSLDWQVVFQQAP